MPLIIADAAIAIGADFDKFGKQIETDTSKAMGKAGAKGGKEFGEQAADGVKKSGLGARIQEAFSPRNLLQGAAMGVGMELLNMAKNAVSGLAGGMIGGAAEMERYDAQLQTLLGSAGAAKDRLAELKTFAATTPFEMNDVIEASKTLQVFTKGILATGDGLRLVGDVAAGTNTPFGEAAVTFGRLYDAMASGRPFGEATARLQEMGAMSGESRARVEALAKSVADGTVPMADAWKSVAGEFGMFSGLMDKQSGTLEGKWSNLLDAVSQGLAEIGTQGMPLFKGAIDALIPVVTAIAGVFKTLAENADIIVPVVAALAIVWVASLLPALIATLPALIATAAAAAVTAAPFLLLAGVVAALAFAFRENLFGVRDIVTTVFGIIGAIAKGVVGTFLNVAGAIVGVVAALPGPLQDAAKATKKTLDDMRADVDAWGTEAGKDMGESTVEGYRVGAAGIVPAATDTVSKVAQAIIDGKAGIISAWKSALTERNTAANAKDQIIINNAAIAAAKKVLADKKATAAEKAEARIRIRGLRDSNTELLVQQSQYGTRAQQIAKTKALLTSKALLAGLKSKDPEVRQHWIDVKTEMETQLNALEGPAGAAGAAAASAFMSSLWAGVRESAYWASEKGDPGPRPPKPVTGGGGVTVPGTKSWDVGTPFVPRDMLSYVHRGEIIVPSKESDEIRSGRATLGAGGAAAAGASTTVNVYNPKPERASESVPRALANLAFLGSGA